MRLIRGVETRPDPARRLVEDDLATFRRRLDDVRRRLDGGVVGQGPAEHHRVAREAWRRARSLLPTAGDTDALVAVVGLVAVGRQHLAHVEAHVTADDPPARRPPCLFDPAHGPSVTDARWTTVRHGTRRVPVCLQDTALLAAGVPPEARTVEVGGRVVPYWEGSAGVEPYLLGYFPGHPVLTWIRDPGRRLPRRSVAPPGSIYGDADLPGATFF